MMTKTTHEEAGFTHWRELEDGIEIGIMRMLFTYDLCYKISTDTTEIPYLCRYSYEYEQDAMVAFDTWDGNDFPPGNWIKRKSAILEEISNPNHHKRT
jgi:hypothetical protein